MFCNFLGWSGTSKKLRATDLKYKMFLHQGKVVDFGHASYFKPFTFICFLKLLNGPC